MAASWLTEHVGIVDTLGYGGEETVASYVVKGSQGAALIDVGYSTTWEKVLLGLGDLGVSPESVVHVFLTHFHLDHSGALGELMPRLPKATVVAHERAVRHLIDPSKLVSATQASFGRVSTRLGGLSPVQPERIEPAQEDSYELGGIKVTPLFTPGHVPSHVSFFVDEGTVFSGDAICVSRRGLNLLLPPGSPPMYDVRAAEKSVEAIRALTPRLLLSPHFGPQPTSKEAFERQTQEMERWLDAIASMVDEGMKLDGVVEEMRKRTLGQAGLKPSDLDEFAKEVLMGPLLEMTVESFMGYVLSGRMGAQKTPSARASA